MTSQGWGFVQGPPSQPDNGHTEEQERDVENRLVKVQILYYNQLFMAQKDSPLKISTSTLLTVVMFKIVSQLVRAFASYAWTLTICN